MLNQILLMASQGGEGGNSSYSIVFLLLMFVILYFLMIRPQTKKQKELRKFRESLQKGDKVLTIGGIYGKIVEIDEKFCSLEVDNNVKIKFDRACIASKAANETEQK